MPSLRFAPKALAAPALAAIFIGALWQASSPDVVAWSLSHWIWLLIAAGSTTASLIVPGLALTRLLWRDSATVPLSALERLGLSAGIGVALPPLVLLACQALGVVLGPGAMIVYLAVSLIILVVRRSGANKPTRLRLPSQTSLAVAAILGLAVAVRLFAIRDLPVGLFGDSLHHTLITQLIVDHGSLFASWEPYAPLTTMTYHFGFHANAAFVHWISGVPVPQSLLVTGQMHSAFSIIGAYALASRLARLSGAPWQIGAWAGLFTAVLTGFVNPQPAYFVNWGRFTQLAGQLILPAVMLAWAQLFENARSHAGFRQNLPQMAIAGIATAGLICTHYIVTIWAALLTASYLVAALLAWRSARLSAITLIHAAVGAVIAIILSLPWLLNTMSGYLSRNTGNFVAGAESAARVAALSALGPIVPDYLNRWVLLTAVLGLLIAFAARHWRVALLAAWSALIVLSITPRILGLPGTGVVNWLTGYIALYVTVTPLAGYAIAQIAVWISTQPWLQRPALAAGSRAAPAIAALLLSLFGVQWQRNIVNAAAFQLVTPADMSAMAWIKQNTPSSARFLVNAFPAYDGTMLAGNDAGWWLPYLSGRASTLPPITYGSERGVVDRPDVLQNTIYVWTQLRIRPLTDATPTAIDLTTTHSRNILNAAGITHVYIGANSTPPRAQSDHVDAEKLRENPGFALVYEREGVSIFALR